MHVKGAFDCGGPLRTVATINHKHQRIPLSLVLRIISIIVVIIIFVNYLYARKLHNEELNDLYSLSNIVRVVKSRRMRWAGHVAHIGEDRGVHRVLVGKPEGQRPLGRPRRRWEDNIKIDL